MKLSVRDNIEYAQRGLSDKNLDRYPVNEMLRICGSMRAISRLMPGFVLIMFILITLTSCSDVNPTGRSGLVMDTVFTVTVYGDRDMPDELLEAASQLDKSVLSGFSENSLVSRYTTDVYGKSDPGITDHNGDGIIDDVDRRHAMSGYTATVADKEFDLYEIFSRCEDIRYDSAGRFDVRIGALSDLWNIKGNMTVEDGPHIPVPA